MIPLPPAVAFHRQPAAAQRAPEPAYGRSSHNICKREVIVYAGARMKGERLGEFEELTLLAVLALGEGAYGVPVQELIEREAGREVTLGAVYAALERMERKGLLASRFSDAVAERGGKRRRLFSVTDPGLRVLHDTRRAREALWNAVPRSIRSRT